RPARDEAGPSRGLLGAWGWRRGFGAVPGGTDPDGLDVGELLDPVLRQLAAVARALHAAERKPGVGSDHAVDEDEPGLDLLGEPLAALDVAGPDVGAKPVFGVVGDTHRVI